MWGTTFERTLLLSTLVALVQPANAAVSTLPGLVTAYGLSTSYNFSFPDSATKSGADYVTSQWSVYNKVIDFGSDDIAFVNDPASGNGKRELDYRAPSSTSLASSATSVATAGGRASSQSGSNGNTVLEINYPQGSYSKHTGGTQFYSLPIKASSSTPNLAGNSTSNGQFERMLLSYDIYFPPGYDFVLGGKLPGLRGGPNVAECSGGHEADAQTCFSTRLMWRETGLGEVYAYIPTTTKGFCKQDNVVCNSDFGSSLGRGTFSFITGQWQTIWLYVALNEEGVANGEISLWYNGVRALHLTQLGIRGLNSQIDSVGGLYFSTFFGGGDTKYATPSSQNSYYRNIQLWGGLGAANGTGAKFSAAAVTVPLSSTSLVMTACGVISGLLAFGGVL